MLRFCLKLAKCVKYSCPCMGAYLHVMIDLNIESCLLMQTEQQLPRHLSIWMKNDWVKCTLSVMHNIQSIHILLVSTSCRTYKVYHGNTEKFRKPSVFHSMRKTIEEHILFEFLCEFSCVVSVKMWVRCITLIYTNGFLTDMERWGKTFTIRIINLTILHSKL